MNSNLDVWAIQHYPGELQTALSNILTDSKNNILFHNCVCSMELGGELFSSRQFDTMLYAEDSDTLILLMRDGVATADDIKSYLNEKNILYHDVFFEPLEDEYQNNNSIKELWFAREAYVLRDALDDSKQKGYSMVTYYPSINGFLKLQYITMQEQLFSVDGRNFQGMIDCPDKTVLLIDGDERSLTERQVYSILDQQRMHVIVDPSTNVPCKEKKLVRALR